MEFYKDFAPARGLIYSQLAALPDATATGLKLDAGSIHRRAFDFSSEIRFRRISFQGFEVLRAKQHVRLCEKCGGMSSERFTGGPKDWVAGF